MHGTLSRRALIFLTAAGGLVALVVAFAGSRIAAAMAGVLVLATALVAWRNRSRIADEDGDVLDQGRRAFLGIAGAAGLAIVAGGAELGHLARRLVRPDPKPVLEGMAHGLGSDSLELVRRAYYPGRSGDLQLLLAPFNSSNYPQESTALVPNDPRSSHASVWMYLERVPITVYAPGIVEPADHAERVTLADLASTAAHLMGFTDFAAPDGVPLPGIPQPPTPPKMIVTFVIDGGGWNVLREFPDAWPNLKALMAEGATYRNAIMGSFPAVTACAHATIGTGAFPRHHGISGHNIRYKGRPVKAYGEIGHADPSFLLSPTLAEAWSDHTNERAWIGEIGYQIWHLGMIGRGGTAPLGDKPVAVYWDDKEANDWASQNPDLYRLPARVPPVGELWVAFDAYTQSPAWLIDGQFNRFVPKEIGVCCGPPIIKHQGDLIESTFASEPVGRDGDATSLLYINFKAPDYAGHVYNMLSLRESFAVRAVDQEIGRVRQILEQRFAPAEFALIVTADHGQCPTVDVAGGVRLDPIQLEEDLTNQFGHSVFTLVESVVPSEVYLSEKAMSDAGITRDDVAAFLRDYRYRDNIGPYVPQNVIEHDRLDQRIFAAVLSTDFIAGLGGKDLSGYGAGSYANADPGGTPDATWLSS